MAGRRKFDKLELNENYHAATGEKLPEAEKKRSETRSGKDESDKAKKKDFSLAKFFGKSPEPINPPSRFTYSKMKRVGVAKKEKTAEDVKAPSSAPFLLMAGVFVLMLLARHFVFANISKQLSQDKAALVDVIVNAAVFLVPTLVYILSAPERKKRYYARGFSASTVPFAVTMLFFVICFTALQKYYITYNYMYSVEMGTASKNVLLVLLTGAVVPAIFEQLFVHGVFQYEISKYAGGFCGVFVSSLVFALLQFDLRYLLVYFSVGLVMGSVTHVSGSVFPAMIMRFISCSVSIFFSDRITFVAQERIGGVLLMIILAALSFVFLIAALRVAERISNKRVAEYIRSSKEQQETAVREKVTAKDEKMFLVAEEGNTAARFGKVILSPYMLFAAAVFVAELLLKQL